MNDVRHPGPKLLDKTRGAIRARGMSPRTQKAYVRWVVKYIRYHKYRRPETMGEPEISAFLTHLAVDLDLSASTQNQAASAIVFLYREVLGQDVDWLADIVRAKRSRTLPIVLSVEEVHKVLQELRGGYRLVASILYGAGLRLNEVLCLRVKDVDLTRGELMVRSGKGGQDRRAILPRSLREKIAQQLDRVAELHAHDLKRGRGTVQLPGALARKFPNANRELAWQWFFPAVRHHKDELTGEFRRHHLHPSAVQRAVKSAVRAAGVRRRASCHTFRHHADIGIMPTAGSLAAGMGGIKGITRLQFGIITGFRGRREADRQVGSVAT